MSATIVAQPLTYPSSYKPPNSTQGVLNAVAAFTKYSLTTGAILAVTGPSTPTPEDQDKIWFQTDATGRPLQVNLYYNGNWRQFYTGKPYEVAMYVGYWANDFDSTGLGLLGLPWDGWAIANGNNGTQNLTNKFIIPGYRADGVGTWVTNVSGADAYTGGTATFLINTYNLPPLTITLFNQAGLQAGNSQFGLYDSQPGSNPVIFTVNGTGAQTPVANLPPYLAVGFAQFIGYTT